MKQLLTFSLSIFLSTYCPAQEDLNHIEKISKSQFKELKSKRERFIPADLKTSKALIVKPSEKAFAKLRRRAKAISLFRNGYDTTSINSNVAFNYDSSAPNASEEYAKRFFPNVVNQLAKKGIKVDVVMSGHENEFSIKEFRYLIMLDFVSNMRDPVKAYWIRSVYYFIDRTDNRVYETFLPENYPPWGLIDKPLR